MYERSGSTDWRRLFGAGSTPFTFGVMAVYIVLFFLLLLIPGLGSWLAFRTELFPMRFWTLFTWPVAAVGDPLSLIFALGWIFLFGGSMERSWGTRTFGTFFVATNVLTALVVWLTSLATGPGVLAGLWVATAPVVVAWSIVNAREVISFFFLPIPGPVWGLIGAATAFFYGGAAYGKPLIGIAAMAGCAAAYWYARFGRYQSGSSQAFRSRFGGGSDRSERDMATSRRFRNLDAESGQGSQRPFSLTRWWRDRQERKRLEEIFRRSGFNDPDEKRR